jgi:hypothetical protein
MTNQPRKPRATPAPAASAAAPGNKPEPAGPPAGTSSTAVAVPVADKLGLKTDAAGNLDITSLAYVLQTSKLFPDIQTVSQGIVKILVGREMGFGPMQSVMGVHLIRTKGRDNEPDKVTIMVGAHLIAAKIKGSGRYDYDVLQLDPLGCELQPYAKRNGEWKPLARIKYTVADAKTAMLGGFDSQKYPGRFNPYGNWAKDPQSMCFARAMTRMEKVHFADLTGIPAYTPDELGYRVDDAGNALVVNGRLVPDDLPQGQEPQADPKPQQKLREVASPVSIARMTSWAQDKGWPLEGLLDMLFTIDGYVDQRTAEVAWDAGANQRLLELVASESVAPAMDLMGKEEYKIWLAKVEAAAQTVADETIEAAKSTKEAQSEATTAKEETIDVKPEPKPEAKPDPGENEISPEQYDDLYALISDDKDIAKTTREFARSLGYSTLKKIKVKDLKAVTDHAQKGKE